MRLAPSPKLNLDANEKPTYAALALPLMRSLREQTPENPPMLTNLPYSIGCNYLHNIGANLNQFGSNEVLGVSAVIS